MQALLKRCTELESHYAKQRCGKINYHFQIFYYQCHRLTLYWEPLKKSAQNGEGFRYIVVKFRQSDDHKPGEDKNHKAFFRYVQLKSFSN